MSKHSEHEPRLSDLPQHAVPVEPPDAAEVRGGASDLATREVSAARGYNVPSATADGTRGNPPDTAI